MITRAHDYTALTEGCSLPAIRHAIFAMANSTSNDCKSTVASGSNNSCKLQCEHGYIAVPPEVTCNEGQSSTSMCNPMGIPGWL